MKRARFHALLILVCLLGASPALAQSHPCDLPTPTSVPSVPAGQSFTLGACTADPSTGPNALTSVRVYRNGALVSGATVTIGTAVNVDGLRVVSHQRTESAVGTYTFEFEPVNAQGAGPRVSFAAVSVAPAPTLPSALIRPRIQ